VRIFVVGLVMWLATVVVAFATANSNLIPTIILLGSFLTPITFVTYALGRADEVITAQRIFSAFIYGGLLVVLGTSILESAFLRQQFGPIYLGVGLIEEGAVLWLLARRLPRYTMRDGMVLGAAVGFGLAAFESAGYAFNVLFTRTGLSLPNLLETEVLRSILTPVGHGLRTAILGGCSLQPQRAASGTVLGWYVLVALLHALWDTSQAIAVWLTLQLTATPVQWLLIEFGRVPVWSQLQVHLFTALSWGLLVLDALVGLVILRGRWCQATNAGRDPSTRDGAGHASDRIASQREPLPPTWHSLNSQQRLQAAGSQVARRRGRPPIAQTPPWVSRMPQGGSGHAAEPEPIYRRASDSLCGYWRRSGAVQWAQSGRWSCATLTVIPGLKRPRIRSARASLSFNQNQLHWPINYSPHVGFGYCANPPTQARAVDVGLGMCAPARSWSHRPGR
jgi:RsiW-degrading membrane proteinase PrsW (M82 family)